MEDEGYMDQVHFRVNRDLKNMIRKAASANGQSLTDFIVYATLEKARTIMQDHEQAAESTLPNDITAYEGILAPLNLDIEQELAQMRTAWNHAISLTPTS